MSYMCESRLQTACGSLSSRLHVAPKARYDALSENLKKYESSNMALQYENAGYSAIQILFSGKRQYSIWLVPSVDEARLYRSDFALPGPGGPGGQIGWNLAVQERWSRWVSGIGWYRYFLPGVTAWKEGTGRIRLFINTLSQICH